ncbi:hypothetical protein P3T36_001409 [Kitasatospora sp. MAP12-15]|uniref:hypothetical protein n=1 Tax=unclassified Kitasatospora TaxID=2633591 RepID=UPI0024766A9A|nr:hypothetical protein [Kitasatospora sp. MAP12-44]MDH6112526.1 hypothetical protein [Kitasatospora sp. MAP12-44]
MRTPGAPALAPIGTERLKSELYGLVDLYAECEQLLCRTRSGLRERVSGHRANGIPLNEEAVEARTRITGFLVAWSGLVLDQQGGAGPESREPRALAAFLVRHLDWLTAHPAAAELVAELDELTARVSRLTGPTPDLQVDLGPCAHPGCGSTVYAVLDVGGTPSAQGVGCAAGHALPPRQWLLLARRTGQRA